MANAAKLKQTDPVRMLITGFPGAGKTGSLVSLLDAGFKIRLLDFDGNPEPILNFARPDALHNLDILTFEDPITDVGGQYVGTATPTAFSKALQACIRWRYEDPDGELDDKGKRWIDLGKSSDWGPDTILVVDGLTGLSAAIMARAMFLSNKTPRTMEQSTWGLGIQDELNFIRRITSRSNRHHTIVLSHLKMKGPKPIGNEKEEVNRTIKEQIAELIPTRWYPTGIGTEGAQNIAGEFPVVVNISVVNRAGKMVRRFNYAAREDMDVKLPSPKELKNLDVENGLLEIFKALGAVPPLEALAA